MKLVIKECSLLANLLNKSRLNNNNSSAHMFDCICNMTLRLGQYITIKFCVVMSVFI